MEKKVLVCFGERRRQVAFVGTSDGNDSEALTVEARKIFSDILSQEDRFADQE